MRLPGPALTNVAQQEMHGRLRTGARGLLLGLSGRLDLPMHYHLAPEGVAEFAEAPKLLSLALAVGRVREPSLPTPPP